MILFVLYTNDFLRYLHTSIYDHEKENVEKYNAVVISEVIEHVSNKEKFLKSCINTLKVSVIHLLYVRKFI